MIRGSQGYTHLPGDVAEVGRPRRAPKVVHHRPEAIVAKTDALVVAALTQSERTRRAAPHFDVVAAKALRRPARAAGKVLHAQEMASGQAASAVQATARGGPRIVDAASRAFARSAPPFGPREQGGRRR